MSSRDRVSVIIPMLNEEDQLPALLTSLRDLGDEIEVIFVDGGSRDRGPALVRAAGHRLLESPPGRARQMNAGARRATGEILLFLHADVRVSAAGLAAMRIAMADADVVAGRFDLEYGTKAWPYGWIAWTGNLRSRLSRIFTGDQTIFVRRSVFEALGGYADIPLMEDVQLARRLKRRGRTACLTARVIASHRKCEREGVWRTLALMWLLRTLHALGVSPARLHRLYYARDPARGLAGPAAESCSTSHVSGFR